MAYKLIVSKEAHRDVDEITNYIANELKNTVAAVGFLNDVESGYRHVEGNPFMYGFCNDERLRNEGYRKIPIKNYLVVYRTDEAQKSVFIVRILYGPRDYTKLL
jgi:addiction module RelE/StbE family toxin